MKNKFKGSQDKWGCVFTSDKKRAVRNKGGLICILTHPSKYSGQDERYDTELEIMRADQKLIASAPDLLRIVMDCRMHFEAIENLGLQNNAPDWLIKQVNKVLEETLT